MEYKTNPVTFWRSIIQTAAKHCNLWQKQSGWVWLWLCLPLNLHNAHTW